MEKTKKENQKTKQHETSKSLTMEDAIKAVSGKEEKDYKVCKNLLDVINDMGAVHLRLTLEKVLPDQFPPAESFDKMKDNIVRMTNIMFALKKTVKQQAETIDKLEDFNNDLIQETYPSYIEDSEQDESEDED